MLKARISEFIHDLVVYDYILFGASFVLFILFIVLGLLLRKKGFISMLFILFSFSSLVLGPTLGYIEMHNYLFKNSTTLLSQKQLSYSAAIVLRGNVTNESKKNFQKCKVVATVHKQSKNALKNYIYSFKSLKRMSIVEENIAKGETREFKMIIEPFRYSKDYNITLKASCK